jgi:hypothetical protein
LSAWASERSPGRRSGAPWFGRLSGGDRRLVRARAIRRSSVCKQPWWFGSIPRAESSVRTLVALRLLMSRPSSRVPSRPCQARVLDIAFLRLGLSCQLCHVVRFKHAN